MSFEELRHWDIKVLEDENDTDHNYAPNWQNIFGLRWGS